MPKRSSKLDLSQLAKRIVDEATGEEPITPPPAQKNQAAIDKRRLDGLKGGKARAESLTSERRSEISKKASQIRWKAKRDEDAKHLQIFPPAKKKHIGV